MPLDQTLLEQQDFQPDRISPVGLAPQQDEFTETESAVEAPHSPAAQLQLRRARAQALACHDDLLKFRRTWDNAFDDPAEAAAEGKASKVKPVDRAALYPKSHILHFSVLAALVLFEGLANAYFFSKGSDLGLLGGWLQAITVSFTNVIAAFFLIGFVGLRHMNNPHKPMVRGLAFGLIGITSIALFLLNLTAAHYRDLLEFNASSLALGGAEMTGVVLTPVTEMWANPFGFGTLEAMLLLILGTTFAAIAAYKGRTFDDALPRYGRVTRRLETAARDLEKALEAGWKDARKLTQPELQALVDGQELFETICRDMAGPGQRR